MSKMSTGSVSCSGDDKAAMEAVDRAMNGSRRRAGFGFGRGFTKTAFGSPDEEDGEESSEDCMEGSRTCSSATSLSSNELSSVVTYEPLPMPFEVKADFKIDKITEKMIDVTRKAIIDVISGKDDRLVVIVGPCSIHNVQSALDYAHRLKAIVDRVPNLIILMRTYFEKPRTTVGWKGLINDPDLDGSCRIERGIRIARKLLVQINQIGLPVGMELLDTISPQYLSDLISWGAIGARTTESQLHRELSSAAAHPIGFKNGTDGGVSVAIDAMSASRMPHTFLGVSPRGRASIVKSHGNADVHVILRGGSAGTNYDQRSVRETRERLLARQAGHHPSVMIDCSHGNSRKNYRNQSKVVQSICEQLSAASDEGSISGVMIESHIHEGRQDIKEEGPSGLQYGVSITDGCVNFEDTVNMLEDLDAAVAKRRGVLSSIKKLHKTNQS